MNKIYPINESNPSDVENSDSEVVEVTQEAGDDVAYDKAILRQQIHKADIDLLAKARDTPYADNEKLFQPRIKRGPRLKYWEQIVTQVHADRVKPKGFKPWVMEETATDNEAENYPILYVWLLKVSTSALWDHWYLNLFMIWLILLEIYMDRITSSETSSFIQFIVSGPLVVMVILQLIPIGGSIFLICRCNDLMHLFASKNFPDWNFGTIMMSQYFEHFYFGGRDRRHAAGRCRRHALNPTASGILTGSMNVDGEQSDWDMKSQDDSVLGGQSLKYRDDDSLQGGTSLTSMDKIPMLQNANRISGSNESFPSESNIKINNSINLNNRQVSGELSVSSKNPLNLGPFLVWTCVTCGVMNREPQHPHQEPQLLFETTGQLHKRTFVVIKYPKPIEKRVPVCRKCTTPANYIPPAGSAHLFSSFSKRFDAFNNYPVQTEFHPGLSTNPVSRLYSLIMSFFIGTRNDVESYLLYNDWRLIKYLQSRVPEIMRAYKSKHELYQVGEVVECQQQKLDYTRARILVSRKNHSYDIAYESGEILRYINEAQLRLPPAKKPYMYRIELAMCVLILVFPVSLLAAIYIQPVFILLGPFLVSLYLSLLRVLMFLRYFFMYSSTGLLPVLSMTIIFSLPVWLLCVACVIAFLFIHPGSYVTWMDVFYALVMVKVTTLPLLLMMRSFFLPIAILVFVQLIVGEFFLAKYGDTLHYQPLNSGSVSGFSGFTISTMPTHKPSFLPSSLSPSLRPSHTPTYSFNPTLQPVSAPSSTDNNAEILKYALVPFLTATFTIKILRVYLHSFIDPCLVIRPSFKVKHSQYSAESDNLYSRVGSVLRSVLSVVSDYTWSGPAQAELPQKVPEDVEVGAPLEPIDDTSMINANNNDPIGETIN